MNPQTTHSLKHYHILTFGCQMNKHDSERVAGLLEAKGMSNVETPEEADVVVFMTCCVRERADERLYGQVASLKAIKTGANPNLIIAVGGCIGQRDKAGLIEQMRHVDIVFGTQNVEALGTLIDKVVETHMPQVQVIEEGDSFTSDLPSVREDKYHAWLPITLGCNNFCTYCVVPYVRGRERSRKFEDIVAEARSLIKDGVKEITLLGQNVNSYGRDLYGEPKFAELLNAISQEGVLRLGFATSHPKDLSDKTIAAMANSNAVLDYLHLPFQSGSNDVLKRMNRRYTREDYLSLVQKLNKAMPGIALSTDIIVGFPGETDQAFEDTLDLVRQADIDHAFTFIYSPREETPAATYPDQIDREVSGKRFERLVKLVQDNAYKKNQSTVGTIQRVLIEGLSKRDAQMLSGRSRQYKVVHAPLPAGKSVEDFEGKEVEIRIDEAQTWFLKGEIV